MRFGCCGSVNDAAAIAAVGFEFLEVNVQSVLRGHEADATWTPPPNDLPLPIEAANCLLPGSYKTVGPDRDLNALRTYMTRVAERARQLGIKRLVFGSGDARRRPDGIGPDQAQAELAEFLEMAGPICGERGVTLTAENLNAKETNTLNTLDQVRELIERVGLDSVRALVDSFHAGLEGDPIEAVARVAPVTAHVHLAEPDGRAEPGAVAEPQDLVPLFRTLRAAGYRGAISVEARWSGPIEERGAAALAHIKRAWHAAGS